LSTYFKKKFKVMRSRYLALEYPLHKYRKPMALPYLRGEFKKTRVGNLGPSASQAFLADQFGQTEVKHAIGRDVVEGKDRASHDPQQVQEEEKDRLLMLEEELRKDQIKSDICQDGEFSWGTPYPDPHMRQQQRKYLPLISQYKHEPQLLGDFSMLVSQMEGQQSSANDAFILSTLESRRPAYKLSDTSGDGYNLLANTFGLGTISAKSMKRQAKKPRFDFT
jgi:hypothetical protein